MKPESAAFLDKARDLLERASGLLAQQFTDEVGRNAYFAGFEKTDRSPKTHSGVQAEFARLAKREPVIDDKLRAFLGRVYNLKALADYETGAGSKISAVQAADAIEAGRSFIATLEKLIDR